MLIPQPRVGEVVTFTYERTARRGTLPLGPKVVRVRTDLTWGDVVRTAVSDLRLAQGEDSYYILNIIPFSFFFTLPYYISFFYSYLISKKINGMFRQTRKLYDKTYRLLEPTPHEEVS